LTSFGSDFNIQKDVQLGIYILASTVILAGAGVAVVYFLSKAASEGARHVAAVPENVACEGRKVAEVLAGTAGTLGGAAIQTTTDLVRPVSDGVGEVLRSIAARIGIKQKDLAALRSKVLTLTQEIEALKARHISIDRVKSILQLALIEADFNLHNIKKDLVIEKDGGFFGRDEEVEYLGIFNATYKQRLGLDLEKLRFQIDQTSPSTVAVAGLGQTEVIGILKPEIKRIHSELRRHLKPAIIIRGEQWEILPSDDENRTLNSKEQEQRDEIMAQMNANTTRKEIDVAIEKLAFSFLETCFAPAHYTLIRATEPLKEPKSFPTITAEINAKFQKQINDKAKELKEETDKCLRTEGELQELNSNIQNVIPSEAQHS
jgi:hypothetical protein